MLNDKELKEVNKLSDELRESVKICRSIKNSIDLRNHSVIVYQTEITNDGGFYLIRTCKLI